MKIARTLILLVLQTILLTSATWSDDGRYGGPPDRDADGSIKRSRTVLREFQRIHPCPSTGETTGSCPGWNIDHVVPLVCFGRDAIENLQWLPVEIKRCASHVCKDRWERRVYCRAPPAPIKPQPTASETQP